MRFLRVIQPPCTDCPPHILENPLPMIVVVVANGGNVDICEEGWIMIRRVSLITMNEHLCINIWVGISQLNNDVHGCAFMHG